MSHKKVLDIAQNKIDKKLKPEKEDKEGLSNEIEALRNVVARPVTPNWKNDENLNLFVWNTGANRAELKEEMNK